MGTPAEPVTTGITIAPASSIAVTGLVPIPALNDPPVAAELTSHNISAEILDPFATMIPPAGRFIEMTAELPGVVLFGV